MEYICNNSTNKFETFVGMLNMAPTKVSGQYKLVYDKNLKPWLDDYNGRRVALDTSISFLQQVANFLSVKTFVIDTNCLRFGGFQRNTVKSWHIPFYFGSQLKEENYPKYFVVSRVPNETYEQENFDNLYKFGLIVKAIDLKHIGLYNILNEIQSEPYFNYPLYFNHQEQKVQLFGFGINEQYPCQYTLNLTKAYANQAYLDVINNKILNSFANNNIIFPRFLNIEFEFDYDVLTEQDFNNFYGYLSNSVTIDKEQLPSKKENNNGYFIKSRLNKFVYSNNEQISDYILDGLVTDKLFDKINLSDYLLEIGNCSVNEIAERPPQVRFKLTHINVGDIFRIIHDGYVFFEYQVTYNDTLFDTLYDIMLYLCKKMTTQANYDYEFSCTKSSTNDIIIKVVSNIDYDELFEIYDIKSEIILPYHAQQVDGDFKFRGIGQNDTWLYNLTENQNYLVINNIKYKIVDKFWFEEYFICRLVQENEIELWENKIFNEITPLKLTKLTTAFIYETKTEEIKKLEPINFLTYYPEIQSETLGNFENYISCLKQKFLKTEIKQQENEDGSLREIIEFLPKEEQNSDFVKALEDFTGLTFDELKQNNIENIFKNKLIKQFVKHNEYQKLEDTNELLIEKHNESIVKNILFNSMGYTGFMTPNILNIDIQEWIQNGCIDIEKNIADLYRYSWFLIAGEQPEYLKNNWRYMEYSEEKNHYCPKITSRLIKVNDSLCETIFLGVKYQLPIQYENWEFAVYLNFNDPEYLDETEYFVETYPEENLILLSINKFIDFSDLIRGGDQTNQPLLDLSFFNNIKTSYNNCSDYFVNFYDVLNDNKLILEPFYNLSNSNISFNGKVNIKDWIQEKNGQKYFCVRTSNVNDLTKNFEEGKNKSIYVTAKIKYNNKEYTYNSMKLTFENIYNLHPTYFWFTDLKVSFFDTRDVYLRRYDQKTKKDEVIRVQFDNIGETNIILPYSDIINDENSPFKNYHKIVTLIQDNAERTFELLLPQNVDEKTGVRTSNPISLLNDWFRITKIITENVDGSKNNPIINSVPIINTTLKNNNPNLYNYLNNLKTELLSDTSIYNSEVNLFDRNQIWRIVQDMLLKDIRFKEYTEKQMYQELSKFSVENFLNLQNKSIKIKNQEYTEFSDNYIVINTYSIDKNYVIWNIENDNKIVKINRYNSCYLPLLPVEPNICKFQRLNYQRDNRLWNLYDEAFGGYITIKDDKQSISGTSLWEEVQGNLISTLFCRNDEILLATTYPLNYDKPINYFELFKKVIDYDKIIVTNDNYKYIETLNKNVRPYIIETYTLLLLKNFYKLDSVTSNVGLKIPYTIDKQNQYSIYVPDKFSFGVKYQNLNTLVLKFIRK